jgi:acetolactate decarboxylase
VPDKASAISWAVRWTGAQRDVLAGDVSGKIALESLAGGRNLYALGPVEGLRGEVTIFDNEPCVSRVVHRSIEVDASFEPRACFLVYAHVRGWVEVPCGAPIEGMERLETMAVKRAAEHGIDVTEPFPFRLTGLAERLALHVLDKRDGLPHTPELHEQAKVRFSFHGEPVEVLGFFSSQHRGIFTPRESNVHMHARLRDGRVAGHVDDVRCYCVLTATLVVPRITPVASSKRTKARFLPGSNGTEPLPFTKTEKVGVWF